MPTTPTALRGINRGLKRYKYRCYEQVRVTYNGMGCEWSHGFFRTDTMARTAISSKGNPFDLDGPDEVLNRRRVGDDNPDMFCPRRGEGREFEFERGAQRINAWHRHRSDDCVNPPLDDEDWIDD